MVHDSGVHRIACVKRDMAILLKLVFSKTPGRQHVIFKKLRDPLHYTTIDELKIYITAGSTHSFSMSGESGLDGVAFTSFMNHLKYHHHESAPGRDNPSRGI